MIRAACLFAALALQLLGGAGAALGATFPDDQRPLASILHSNPFERLNTPEEIRAPPIPVINVPPPWSPELRGTLVSPWGPMVNVDGVILEIGEEIDGFRLVEVREYEAVFVRDGARRTLIMD